MDPATFRALKWAALIRAVHCSFSHSVSSPPLHQSFVFPDVVREQGERPGGEQVFRELRRSARNRGKEVLEPAAMGRKDDWRLGLPVPDKLVRPVAPTDAGHREQLRKDLRKMGCEEFLYLPWDLHSDTMLQELGGKPVPAEFRDSEIRGQWKKWTSEHWRVTYNFPDSPFGYDKTKQDYGWVKERFSQPVSEKNGFRVQDCIDDRERRLLRFLVPILSPDKPTTCTIKLTKTIYEAYFNTRKTGWGLIVDELVVREARKLGSKKGCPLTPFLFHLYDKHGCLKAKEREQWENCRRIMDREPPRAREGNPDESEDEDSPDEEEREEQEGRRADEAAVNPDIEEGQPEPSETRAEEEEPGQKTPVRAGHFRARTRGQLKKLQETPDESEPEEEPDQETPSRGQVKRHRRIPEEEEEEEDEDQDTIVTGVRIPPRKRHRKMTPVDSRRKRTAPESSGRQNNVKVKTKRARESKPVRDEEEYPEEIRTYERAPRNAGPELEDIPLRESEEDFFKPVREALETMEGKYRPICTSMKEVGRVIQSTQVERYPEIVRRMRKEVDKLRREALERSLALVRQQDEIRALKEQKLPTYRLLASLFKPDGEAQTEARLYREKVVEAGLDDAARVTNVVKKYAARVEAGLVEFRKLLAEHQARFPSGSEPDERVANPRGMNAPLASSDLLAAFHVSQDAPRMGEMDRMMAGGQSTPEQTSRPAASPVVSMPRRNPDASTGGDQSEASLANLADQAADLAEIGTTPGRKLGPGEDQEVDGQPDVGGQEDRTDAGEPEECEVDAGKPEEHETQEDEPDGSQPESEEESDQGEVRERRSKKKEDASPKSNQEEDGGSEGDRVSGPEGYEDQ